MKYIIIVFMLFLFYSPISAGDIDVYDFDKEKYREMLNRDPRHTPKLVKDLPNDCFNRKYMSDSCRFDLRNEEFQRVLFQSIPVSPKKEYTNSIAGFSFMNIPNDMVIKIYEKYSPSIYLQMHIFYKKKRIGILEIREWNEYISDYKGKIECERKFSDILKLNQWRRVTHCLYETDRRDKKNIIVESYLDKKILMWYGKNFHIDGLRNEFEVFQKEKGKLKWIDMSGIPDLEYYTWEETKSYCLNHGSVISLFDISHAEINREHLYTLTHFQIYDTEKKVDHWMEVWTSDVDDNGYARTYELFSGISFWRKKEYKYISLRFCIK